MTIQKNLASMLLDEVENYVSNLKALEETISNLRESLHRLKGGLGFSGFKDCQPYFLRFDQVLENTLQEIESFKKKLSEVHRDLSSHIKET